MTSLIGLARPRLLDLFCRAGGASMGYHLAGFDVTGVDKGDHSGAYPFTYHQADAIEFVIEYGREFDVIAGSPPCQLFSQCHRIRRNDHPDLIGPMRDAVLPLGKPYVIENVEDARADLRDPVELCGAMFPELNVYRHRLFESNVPLFVPVHPVHVEPQVKMGRPPRPGHRMHVIGNFSGVAAGRVAMGIDWMTRDDLREAIPPAYTHFLGGQVMAALTGQRAA
ncbi:DNA cytosine methyltransferase [Cryptosporangium phraense]|uniref:DNA cytosine methyltransferase n=1 Tax=Cryptosporangium phraense TaxID=2593070 RepID=A0A545AT19_9ACTN|nr:DNA cytosine methyltransferase [Cryptosporangium phraense]TQS43745.1 DNA cytosine methyltransferase [Cryptosporangium phraense]